MWTRRIAIAAAAASLGAPAFAAVNANEAAPAFTGLTSAGETVSLAEFAGKTVILEWTNHDCPYVKKHYETDNMQGLQTAAADDEIVWLSVISSAPGKQGHVSADEANALTQTRGAAPAEVILDESGDIGRAYGAKTTPHMFVIDGDQMVRYAGAIDDNRSSAKSSVAGATNYVSLALAKLGAGEAVDPAQTSPYGCSVKY